MALKQIRPFFSVFFIASVFFQASLGAAPPDEITTRDTEVTQVVKPTEMKNPYQLSGEALVNLMSKMVDFSLPSSNIIFERRSGQLFIKQTPANHGHIENILADLRRAAFRQVEIEARFVTVSSQNFKGVGVDFAGVNAALTESGIVIGTAGLGTPLVPAAGTFNSFLDFPTVTGFGSSPLGQQLSFIAKSQKVDFSSVYDALEHLGEVNALSAPKLTVFNSQRAQIKIETVQNYVSKIDSTLTGRTIGVTVAVVETTVKISQAHSGTILDVTPTVNQNGTVTLELQPQNVTADLTGTQSIRNVTGSSAFDNSVTLPIFKSQEINTTVTIPNGGFAVMGGLITDDDQLNDQRIPYFYKVPLLGSLLSNRQTTRRKSYLLIFVQARVKGYGGDEKLYDQRRY